MSIIYRTLLRLETENGLPAYTVDRPSPPLMAVEPRGFPAKTAAAAITVAIAGISLMFWLQGDKGVDIQGLAKTTVTHRTMAAEKPNPPLLATSIVEPPTASPESTGANIGTSTEQAALPAMEKPVKVVAVTNGLPSDLKEQATGPAPGEEPVIEAVAKVDAVSSPIAVTKSVPAAPEEITRNLSSETAPPIGADEAIERARQALSRGHYQQTLSTLELLDPVPENRADFWLIKGSAHLGIGQLDSAEVAFASAQALAPDNVQIDVQLAILKQEKGDHVGALQILKAAAIRHPNVPEIFLNQGYSQQALGAVIDARHSFRAFLYITENRSLYSQQRDVVKEWLAEVSSI